MTLHWGLPPQPSPDSHRTPLSPTLSSLRLLYFSDICPSFNCKKMVTSKNKEKLYRNTNFTALITTQLMEGKKTELNPDQQNKPEPCGFQSLISLQSAGPSQWCLNIKREEVYKINESNFSISNLLCKRFKVTTDPSLGKTKRPGLGNLFLLLVAVYNRCQYRITH